MLGSYVLTTIAFIIPTKLLTIEYLLIIFLNSYIKGKYFKIKGKASVWKGQMYSFSQESNW